MDILYYPNLLISDEQTLKALLLFWGDVRTIVPPSEKRRIDFVMKGHAEYTDKSLDLVKKVNDTAGWPAVDFVVISNQERLRSSKRMIQLLDHWGKDSHFFDQYRINSLDDLMGKWIEYYWFLHEKLEWPLVRQLMRENLAVNWAPGEIVSLKEIGHTYMSILGDEIRQARTLPLVTDQELHVIPRLYSHYTKAVARRKVHYDGYQLVALAVPDVFISKKALKGLSFKQVFRIRSNVLPYAEAYHKEIADYQRRVNKLAADGQDREAFELFLELSQRAAISFRPFAKEYSRILKFFSNSRKVTLLTGIAMPTVKLFLDKTGLEKYCEIGAISATAASYYIESKNIRGGFEFLSTLNRSIRKESLINRLNILIPKKMRS